MTVPVLKDEVYDFVIAPALEPTKPPTLLKPVILPTSTAVCVICADEFVAPNKPTPVAAGRLINKLLIINAPPLKWPEKGVAIDPIGAKPEPLFQVDVPDTSLKALFST